MVLYPCLRPIPNRPLLKGPDWDLFFHGITSSFRANFEKHTRNTLKDTTVPTVPAIRTGQDLFFHGIRQGPDPDGWETLKSDNMIWNKAVIIAARLLQSTMPIHPISPNLKYNPKSEYRKEKNPKTCRMRIT